MFLRLILNYLKKRKTLKQLAEIDEILKNHPEKVYEDENAEDAAPSAAEDPSDIEIALKTVEPIAIQILGSKYQLSKHVVQQDWEHDDILRSESDSDQTFVHPQVFLDFLCDVGGRCLRDESGEFLNKVKTANWLEFRFMNDSRDYLPIKIAGQETHIRCHYLCPVFHIGMVDSQPFIICAELYDENRHEMPKIITELSQDLLADSSAYYDSEEAVWLQVST